MINIELDEDTYILIKLNEYKRMSIFEKRTNDLLKEERKYLVEHIKLISNFLITKETRVGFMWYRTDTLPSLNYINWDSVNYSLIPKELIVDNNGGLNFKY